MVENLHTDNTNEFFFNKKNTLLLLLYINMLCSAARMAALLTAILDFLVSIDVEYDF